MSRNYPFVALLVLISVLAAGADDGDDRFTSDAARSAQASYRRALSKAKKDYLKSLNDALSAAGKARKAEEVTRIAAEIKRASAGDQRDLLAASMADVVDVEWVGSPNMGTIVLKSDGSLVAEKDDGGCRWAIIRENTIISLTDGGYTAVFVFDEQHRKMTAFATGRQGEPAWVAKKGARR